MDLIVYHAKCTDGWAAAYVASLRYPRAVLLPASYSEQPPYEQVEGKDVLVADFAWKTRKTNIELALLAKSFRILDHHKSAIAELDGLEFFTHDVNRSGAGLTFDYLFGKDSDIMGFTGKVDRPWYVNYVEDYDLWRFNLPYSKEVNTYLHSVPYTKEAWDWLAVGPEKEVFQQALSLGKGMQRQIESDARKLVESANSGTGWGCTIGIVNAPTFMASYVGEALAKTYEIGIAWWERKDGVVTFSLRSNVEGDIDVSKIATKMGGGGHKNAAGFEVHDVRMAASIIDDILDRRHES